MSASLRSLEDWLQVQQSLHSTGIDLTLDRVREVAHRLQLLQPQHRSLTVAGTNGKGSTVEYLTALLRESGHRVGTFTSPHLLRYNERIRIDGIEASDAELVTAFEQIEAARADITLTFFEFNLLAALVVFRMRQVSHAVLEVGLGGRLDAVNIVDADAAIVCSIGMDHRDWLGDSIEGIGREKAGVMRPGRPAVLSDPAMTAAVAEEAARIGARVLWSGRQFAVQVQSAAPGAHWSVRGAGVSLADLPAPALQGAVQYLNAGAALIALAQLPEPVLPTQGQIARALGGVSLPGRFQVLPGPVEWILDVAHNEPAAAVLAANLRARPCAGRTWLVAGILGDKDIGAIARELGPVTDQWILCGIDQPRGLTAAELAQRAPQFAGAALAQDIAAGVAQAQARAVPGDRVVVCGSFLAVAPALQALAR
jgi:dihydrofolate synthase/folylpolyglutamate synthase